jgi:hypothetical protein
MSRSDALSIERLLLEDGACLSTSLCRKLEELGVSPEAARQRVSRANGKTVRRLGGIAFPKGTRFLYHERSFNSPDYWGALVRDLSTASPAYGPAVAAMLARGRIVPLSHFSIVSGSPMRQRGQISSEAVLDRLLGVNVLKHTEVDGIGPCVALAAGGYFPPVNRTKLVARLTTEKILLLAVRDWARRLGWGSYDKIAVRDEGDAQPTYGTFNWDLCGPSYIRPLVRRDNGKPSPGFLVCDVLTGDMDELAIAAFLRKCKLSWGMRKLAPMLPVLVADRFTREAFRLGRSHGIVMATPNSLFGRDVAIGLATLLQTLTKAAAVAVKRPDVISELFDKLSQIEGAAANLRGALFELIMGHAVHAREGGLIDIGKRIIDGYSGDKAEIDVLRIKENQEVWIYEGKAHQPSEIISGEAIDRWLRERVSLIHRILRAEPRFQGCEFHFEYWTTGRLSAEARTILETVHQKTRRYSIGYKEGPDVRKYVAKLRSPGLLATLDQHYFDHPLARFDRKYDAEAALSEISIDLSLGDVAEDSDALPSPLLLLPKP